MSIYEERRQLVMNLVYFSTALGLILGLIQICDYSTENTKTKNFLSYARIAVMFALIGFSLGRISI